MSTLNLDSKKDQPRDEDVERKKLAELRAKDARKRNEATGGVADGEAGSAPAEKGTGVNPENVLDQNTRTVFKKLNKEKYPKEDLEALQKHEQNTRKRNSIIKFINKMIKKYVDE